MISERSFTLQGQIVKILPIEKTTRGEDLGKFYVKTVSKGRNGNETNAFYEVGCLGESAVKYVYQRAQQGAMCKVSGTLSSRQNNYNGKKFLNYSLLADRIIVDEEQAEQPQQAISEPQRYLEETVQGTPSITDDELPF
jgi:hypothetical protein